PDFRDKSGTTPLMFAAQRVHSRDPAQLLITFNANLNAQDSKGNTPLHYTVAFNNATVMDILLNKGASQNIPNNKGQTALDLAIDRKKTNAANFLQSFQDGKEYLPSIFRSIARNKEFKKFFTRLYPFFVVYYLIYVIQLSGHWFWKILYIGFLYGTTYVFRLIIFDRWTTRYVPMAVATALFFWLYTTWFIYFRPIVFDFSIYTLTFIMVTMLSWYNFYKSYATDPGILVQNKESMKTEKFRF
ncbi:Palmitoyltransferase ZDHHC17, partial [Brachionus plicatilis]